MKVLLLANKFPYPAKDGSSIAIMSIIELLLLADFEVHLLSLNTNKHFKDPTLFKTKFPNVELTTVPVNTNITPLNTAVNLLNGKPFHISRFYNKEVNKQLQNLLQQTPFNIVQFEGVFMAPYLKTVQAFSNAKTCIRFHNVEHKIWERQIEVEKNGLKRSYLKLQAQRLKKYEMEQCKNFNAFLPISNVDAKFFQDIAPQTSSLTLACAVDLEKYPHQKSRQNAFSFIASLDWMPNVIGLQWFLEHVWPLVLKELPQAQFYVAGRKMPQSIKELKIKGVHMLGEIPDIAEFMHAYSIFVVPLLSGSGIRIKIIEAMAYGKAIVSTPIGAEGIATNNNNIILAKEAAEMAAQLVHLYQNPAKIEALEKQALQTAFKNYSIPLLSQQLKTFYAKLAQ